MMIKVDDISTFLHNVTKEIYIYIYVYIHIYIYISQQNTVTAEIH